VAGDDNGNWIVSDGPSYRPGGHAELFRFWPYFPGYVSIRNIFAIWYSAEPAPDFLTKGAPNGGHGNFSNIGLLPVKVSVQPIFDGSEHWEAIVFL
jgi:hypothetical protein